MYSEDIDESQLKTIELMLPDTSSKAIEIKEYHYIIKIANDGIIRSIVCSSENNIILSCFIYRKDNIINIKNSEKISLINNLKWDNNILFIRGSSGSYYSTNNEYTQIKIMPENNIIYESPFVKLLKLPNNSLSEINNLGGMALAYFNNTTEITFSNNLDSKILYKINSEKIIGIFYGGMDGNDEYSPPIRIMKDSSTKLHSENQIVNVINYFLLSNISYNIRNVLFPLLFLQNPFTNNNWSYTASSYLKEKNVEYNPNNLFSIDSLPWASSKGYGIGDKIIINVGTSPNDSIILINGYVSKDRPDLFLANSRVKQIRITNLNNGKSKIKNIEDSMQPQIISIRDLNPIKNMNLEIEILSVYSGIKYKDLCIQAIF